MTRALVALFLVAGCTHGTGVFLTIDGTLALDTLAVDAQLPTGTVTRTTAASTLPTTYLAILPDEDATVSLLVRAELGGVTVGTASTPPLVVRAHAITDTTVSFGETPADGGFTVIGSGGAALLTSVWGSSSADVYVTARAAANMNVFYATDGVHFGGSAAGSSTEDLYGVWGSSSSDVVLVGDGALILRGHDGAFTSQPNPGAGHGLRGVWGASSTDVYVVGEANTILHSVTGGWVQQTALGTETLNAVWGSDGAHVWAVGDGGTIWFNAGVGVWTTQASGTGASLRAITGRSSTEIYALGDNGLILRSDGATWSPMTSPTSATLYGAFARADALYACGDQGIVLTSTGGAWTTLSTNAPGDPQLRGVWGDTTALFFVGDGATILRDP
jgi:hypothetical protein